MKILITSGSTITPIDRVRGITNIFNGRTGFEIAKHAVYAGHDVTLLGNSIAEQWYQKTALFGVDHLSRFSVLTFKTFDDLEYQMKTQLEKLGWDAVIHSAAVSDYKVDGVFEDTEAVYNFVKTGKGG
jgi:phosphopantothenoylcysteine synthetase/decarboxylase